MDDRIPGLIPAVSPWLPPIGVYGSYRTVRAATVALPSVERLAVPHHPQQCHKNRWISSDRVNLDTSRRGEEKSGWSTVRNRSLRRIGLKSDPDEASDGRRRTGNHFTFPFVYLGPFVSYPLNFRPITSKRILLFRSIK
jgi:hypothetical protein